MDTHLAGHQAALQRLRDVVQSFADGHMDLANLQLQPDVEAGLFGALPTRYGVVWSDLVDRLQSSANFSGESCSFSQAALVEPLRQWLDAVQTTLSGPPSAPPAGQ
jgi:hypothetical protein